MRTFELLFARDFSAIGAGSRKWGVRLERSLTGVGGTRLGEKSALVLDVDSVVRSVFDEGRVCAPRSVRIAMYTRVC